MIAPTSPRPDTATAIFNLPDYRVTDTEVLAFGQRRVSIETTALAGCPSCGVISTRVHSRRPQRLRDIPVAGPVSDGRKVSRFAGLAVVVATPELLGVAIGRHETTKKVAGRPSQERCTGSL